MSESVRQALSLGLNRGVSFEPASELAALIPARAAPDALRALAAHRVLLEAATPPIELEAGVVAPEEVRPLARQSASVLLQIIFSSEPWLAEEALDVMNARGLRIPHAALLTVLDTQERSLRTRIARVAGERGRWLAHTLKDYLWLLQVQQNREVATLQRTLLEGMLVEREAALREWRDIDADGARECLMANFAQDKADVRVRMLAALANGLTLADEPFLASQLSDRAASVQSAARSLLLKLPDSALRARNRQVLAACLSVRAGEIVVDLPTAWPSQLVCDGLSAPPKDHASPKAFMTRALAAATQPEEWRSITQMAPETFVEALRAHPYFFDILSGWIDAGASFAGFSRPLLLVLRAERARPEFAKMSYQNKIERQNMERQLLAHLSISDWQAVWPQLLRERRHYDGLYEQLPRPWPESIAAEWLSWIGEFLRKRAPEPNASANGVGVINQELDEALLAARRGLPPSLFAKAFALLPSEQHPYFDHINQFLRALELRARIYSECCLPEETNPEQSNQKEIQ